MKINYFSCVATLLCGGLLSPISTLAQADGRGWIPQDSVAVRQFDPAATVSPDGSKIFFISYHGDVSCDCNVSELDVFATEHVRNALSQIQKKPLQPMRRLIRRTSGYVNHAIWKAQWDANDAAIFFQGSDKRGIIQLFRFNISSGNTTTITHWTKKLDVMDRHGNTVVADLSVKRALLPPVYPMHAVTQEELQFAHSPGSVTREDTLVTYRGGKPWRVNVGDSTVIGFPYVFSGDGAKIMQIRSLETIPASWAAYDGFHNLAQYTFVLIDAKHKTSKQIFDAPQGAATRAGWNVARLLGPGGVRPLWSTDRKHVILIDTALPLTPLHPERARMGYIISYNTDSSAWTIIEPVQTIQTDGSIRSVSQVGWLTSGKELFIGHTIGGKPAGGMIYTLQGDRWVGHSMNSVVKVLPDEPEQAGSLGRLSVTLQQGANTPPVMIASDGKHQRLLNDPDPALRGIWRAPMTPFTWKEPSGRMETGGLMLPRDAKGPLPLVIQGYDYNPTSFIPDGIPYPGYAGQSLVARGMAVLTIDIPSSDSDDYEKVTSEPGFEVNEYAQRVDSAIDALASRGFIDRTRVGLIGFSRGGFVTRYVITHPGKNPIAAAVIEDSFTGEFSCYLTLGALGIPTHDFTDAYGGSFWANKTDWLKEETSFNVDRVETPVLYQYHGEASLPDVLPTVGSFNLNRRPFDLLIYPNAYHILTKPRQRVASMESTVDWMTYWLKGEIPPDAATAARWAKLRTEQEAVLADLKAKGKEVAPLPPLVPSK